MEMYYYRETCVMLNQSVNKFYTRFLFKIDALPQDVTFPLDIDATLFNNLSPNVREFLISEVAQVPPRPPTENNHHGTQRIILVKNLAVEAEKNTIIIKAAVQKSSRIRHPMIFMSMLVGNSPIKMPVLVSIFQSAGKIFMVEDTL